MICLGESPVLVKAGDFLFYNFAPQNLNLFRNAQFTFYPGKPGLGC